MNSPTVRIESLNVGVPKTLIDHRGKEFISSIARDPVSEPVEVTFAGIKGDACEYEGHHGNNMAINVFCTELYPEMERLAGKELSYPSFGENFTLSGLPDSEARVGDVLRFGEVLVRVTQPREPCSNIVKYLGVSSILKKMVQETISGYYLTILEAGTIKPGMMGTLESRGTEFATISALNKLMHEKPNDEGEVERFLSVPFLSENWIRSFRKQYLRAKK